jgi:hypothetical protein
LGRFISADTIAPGFANPQNRNRYSYALNNPLKYTDPTGHCGKSTDVAAETEACAKEVANLEAYNIHVGDLNGGLWSSNQLRDVVTAAALMVSELFSDNLSTFLDKIGYVGIYQSADANTKAWTGNDTAPAITYGAPVVGSRITFYQDSFSKGPEAFQRTVVHELAHAWDANSWGFAARDLRLATHSDWKQGKWNSVGKTTEYGRTHDREDWAEAVVETVYNPPSKGEGVIQIDEDRENAVRKRAR